MTQQPDPHAPGAHDFARYVIDWQRSHGRSELPWQNTKDPYRVWLSEVMLQQTQVVTVLSYFARFLARFPTVTALAAATDDEVMGLWSGLGYYSRARNMHRCAQQVVERFAGVFPQRAIDLVTLPGIGRSTAAAIAAFCFGERVAILDGNVKRVLTRVLAFERDLSVAASERALWDMATTLLPSAEQPDNISRYTQGVMDLGATVCSTRKPSCIICPVADLCAGRMEGQPERYPVKSRKLRRTSETLWVLHAVDGDGRAWLEKRPSTGIWAGLYSLPVFPARLELLQMLPESQRASATDEAAFVHVLTHKDLHLHPVAIKLSAAPLLRPGGAWMASAAWMALGLPAPMRRLLERKVERRQADTEPL